MAYGRSNSGGSTPLSSPTNSGGSTPSSSPPLSPRQEEPRATEESSGARRALWPTEEIDRQFSLLVERGLSAGNGQEGRDLLRESSEYATTGTDGVLYTDPDMAWAIQASLADLHESGDHAEEPEAEAARAGNVGVPGFAAEGGDLEERVGMVIENQLPIDEHEGFLEELTRNAELRSIVARRMEEIEAALTRREEESSKGEDDGFNELVKSIRGIMEIHHTEAAPLPAGREDQERGDLWRMINGRKKTKEAITMLTNSFHREGADLSQAGLMLGTLLPQVNCLVYEHDRFELLGPWGVLLSMAQERGIEPITSRLPMQPIPAERTYADILQYYPNLTKMLRPASVADRDAMAAVYNSFKSIAAEINEEEDPKIVIEMLKYLHAAGNLGYFREAQSTNGTESNPYGTVIISTLHRAIMRVMPDLKKKDIYVEWMYALGSIVEVVEELTPLVKSMITQRIKDAFNEFSQQKGDEYAVSGQWVFGNLLKNNRVSNDDLKSMYQAEWLNACLKSENFVVYINALWVIGFMAKRGHMDKIEIKGQLTESNATGRLSGMLQEGIKIMNEFHAENLSGGIQHLLSVTDGAQQKQIQGGLDMMGTLIPIKKMAEVQEAEPVDAIGGIFSKTGWSETQVDLFRKYWELGLQYSNEEITLEQLTQRTDSMEFNILIGQLTDVKRRWFTGEQRDILRPGLYALTAVDETGALLGVLGSSFS